MLRTTPGKATYPAQLSTIHRPPHELYIQSNNWPELVTKPMLAIVGSRKVSPYGRAITSQFAREAAARGITIVSGLALGIDSIAHEAALEVNGKTIAVLPSGLERIYPSSHAGLARRIVEQGGALISEYPPHSKVAFKSNFIARNRIIAGLSQVVLLTEASLKSGSLHTANFAIEQGIDTAAVPGPIDSTLSSGCNSLIKTGAIMVTEPADILQLFNISTNAHAVTPQGSNASETIILELLHTGVHDIDELQMQSGLSADMFQQTLSMLEITGRIQAHGGGTFSLR